MLQAAFLIVVHLLILTQLRFEVWPEMMLMPYLMKNGFELYRDMIVPWTPGLMWILQGWFWLTGLSIWNLKVLTWLIIIFTDILIYLIAAKHWGKTAGIISLISFMLFQPLFDGNGLWFDLAVAPLLLLAFHFDNSLFLAPAFLVKQSVVWLFPLFWKQWKRLVVAVTVTIGTSLVWFWSRGILNDYWFWAYDFTFRLFPRMPGHLDLATWRHWALALAPALIVGAGALLKGRREWGKFFSINCPLQWAFWSGLFVFPRFGLFHFQPMIAFLALEIGSLYNYYKGYKNYKNYILISLMVVYLGFFWFRIIQAQWQKPDRFLEPEFYQVAAKLAMETDKNQPVLLVNGPELAYVLSDRLPPKPWLTQFPWFLELPGFQEKLIDNFKRQNLKQTILFPYQSEAEFVPGSYQPKKLLEYINSITNDEAF
ncbi:hypothetical protein HZB78_06010 [Candidatus Collierbacteria bacterium]|nr:hypothetical protein [Candidatus Collierbacteria bacterium]